MQESPRRPFLFQVGHPPIQRTPMQRVQNAEAKAKSATPKLLLPVTERALPRRTSKEQIHQLAQDSDTVWFIYLGRNNHCSISAFCSSSSRSGDPPHTNGADPAHFRPPRITCRRIQVQPDGNCRPPSPP